MLKKQCNSCNELPISTEVAEPSTTFDTSCHSSVSSVIPNAIEPIKSILTADGIIDDEDDTYDDDAVPSDYADEGEDVLGYSVGSSSRSHGSIDDSTARIFEEAFAQFLWSNPAFSAMSCTTLIRLREKLRWQSAKNAKVEAELRMQLDQLKEENRTTELMLQKELLQTSKIKSLRELELLKYHESRDDRVDVGRYRSSMLTCPTRSRVSVPHVGCSSIAYQDGIRRSKLEQAHMIAEVQKMKRENMKRVMPDALIESANF